MPEYLALNPDAVVPTLVHDGRVLVESSLIIEYLDTLGNAERLMPDDREGEFQSRHWLLRCLDIHDAISTMTFGTTARDRMLATKTPAEIEEAVRRMPRLRSPAKSRNPRTGLPSQSGWSDRHS
ncbi:MAG: glutathione S-transferase N-terminal domain-containing protein [Mesorhizobium sp.]|nr:glutathione S-transferase N-terminal domain-containing protein [Mesorhizobium sp.]